MDSPLALRTRLARLPGPAWIIFAGMFANKFGNFLSVFLVLYLTGQRYSAFQAGMAVGVAGLGGFVGNAVGGAVADGYGRRAAIVVSMAGSGLATLAVPLVHGIWATTALVAVVGVFAQLYRPAAGALLVDVVPEQQRVTAFAVLRLAINLGMAVGPLVGGLLSARSYPLLFVGDALTSFAFGALALLLPAGTRPAKPAPSTVPRATGGYRDVFRDGRYCLLLATMVAGTVVYGQSTVTLPLHVARHGFGNGFYGLLLGLNAAVCVLVELPLTRWTERRGPRRVIAVGMLLMGAGMAGTGLADSRALLILTVLLWTFGEIVYSPICSAYPAAFSPPHLRGRYQAADGLAHTLGQAVGPVLGGFLYARSAPLLWAVTAAIALLGALTVLPAVPRAGRDQAARGQAAREADGRAVDVGGGVGGGVGG
ncbi:MFS family permease [Kitasatospora sp. MAP12-15]|uniref:MDR family MFS transporter n=1 Tax=unclassified Kitasatospora TaxID=2633591 RepID=UPI0024756E72|nr:MFS transporter [Kitasatospora sp. MAP12-44]MDH6114799.1 MFS family permease [Kitasatospora sp. MAP12-44]